jgi:hypothetical protein
MNANGFECPASEQDPRDRDARLQVEAERAEREGDAAGRDPRIDRYRLVIRALRQPLEPQLSDDFAMRVARLALRRDGDGFEDGLIVLLILAMGIAALIFVGPALAQSAHTLISIRWPSLPWHQIVLAALGIGVVWAIDSGWMRLHPTARGQ